MRPSAWLGGNCRGCLLGPAFQLSVLSLHGSPRKSSQSVTSLGPVLPPMTQLPWIDTLPMAATCPSPRFQTWTGPEISSVSMAAATGRGRKVERARVSLPAQATWRRRRWTASLTCPQAALSCGAPCAPCPRSGGTAGGLGRTQQAMGKWTTAGETAGCVFDLSVSACFWEVRIREYCGKRWEATPWHRRTKFLWNQEILCSAPALDLTV